MAIKDIEYVTATLAAAVIRNRDLKSTEAAAEIYFDCLYALKAEDKTHQKHTSTAYTR